MKKDDLVELETYTPEALLDLIIDRDRLRCDAALARKLDVGPPVLSKIRHRRLKISAEILVRIHDLFGLDLDYSRKVAGIPLTPGTKGHEQGPSPVPTKAAPEPMVA